MPFLGFIILFNKTMIDELRSMAVFATVVREGSFRGASRRLNLSTSVISHHVAQLEKRIGCALLYRTTRKLSLTHDGELFFESCARAVDAAQEGLNLIQTQQQHLTGKLKIGAPAILSDGPFLRDVKAFADLHPQLDIELLFSDEFQNQVETGLDVTIRIGWLEDSSLRATKLFDCRSVLCTSPLLLAKHSPITKPSDLATLPWIGSTVLQNFIELVSVNGEKQRISLAHKISVNNGTAARELAVAGAGLTIALDFFVKHQIAAGELVSVLDDWQLPKPSFYAVWPNNIGKNSLVHRFVEHLKGKTN